MKKCPFCAEEIQDEAVKCRYCGSMLDETARASTATSTVRYTHTGPRYVLGFGDDFYGIWDRQSPHEPVQRYPRTDEGWRQAWQQYTAWEPAHAPVEGPGTPAAAPTGAPPKTNGMAIASLVLGILWLFWIGSVLALILGYVAKGDIDRSGGREGGRGLAIAGIVLGWIGIGFLVLGVAANLAGWNDVT